MNLLKNVTRWSWTQLTSELAPPFRRLTRRACRAQLHILVNGTVQYQETTPTTRCCSLLHALKATPPPPVYGVIDLEAMGHRERCSASLKALGAVMDTTRSLIDRLMSHQATVAHMNLRLGSAVATSYEMHYDNVDNVLLQLAGRKRLLLAPPSQIRHAHMGEPRCGPGGVPSTSVPHARHSPIDWRAPREQIDFCFPRASRLQALRVSLNAGEALFLPARWLRESKRQRFTNHVAPAHVAPAHNPFSHANTRWTRFKPRCSCPCRLHNWQRATRQPGRRLHCSPTFSHPVWHIRTAKRTCFAVALGQRILLPQRSTAVQDLRLVRQ